MKKLSFLASLTLMVLLTAVSCTNRSTNKNDDNNNQDRMEENRGTSRDTISEGSLIPGF